MARNRSGEDPADKREAIVAAAATLFLDGGFEATSMTSVAKAAGITKNTVYWYFDGKDALLLAVLSRVFAEARESWFSEAHGSLAERLFGLVDVFRRISGLTATLHVRVQLSSQLSEWHERFHASSEAWLREQIAEHLAAAGRAELDASTATATSQLWGFAIEGMVSQGLPDGQCRELCQLLVDQVDAIAGAPARPAGSQV